MNSSKIHIGIDIAKDSLQIAGPKGLRLASEQAPNTADGHRRLIRLLQSLASPVQVICEATGGYERSLLRALWQAQIPVSLVNPRCVRDFAKAKNHLAKTDSLDANALVDYGQALHPPLTPQPDPVQDQLRDFIDRREQLKTMITAENNRLHKTRHPTIQRLIRKSLTHLNAQLQKLRELIQDLLQTHHSLQQKIQRLCSVQSVGLVTATTVLAAIPELGSLTRTRAAALAGVAPYNRDSGIFRGQRHIKAGRALARKALYMAALVAARRNPILASFYKRLIAKGKPPKVALTALMRKLIVLMNHLLKNPAFQPA